jgi:hypothetical protein
MQWTLIALLSIPGLLMGLLSVKGHTRGIEPFLWVVLAVFAALVISRTAGSRHFMHGLVVGLSWGILNGMTAAALFSIYSQHNPEVMQRLPSGAKYAPQLMFLMAAPLIGLATGIVLGLMCWGATYLIRPAPPLTPTS